MKTWFITGTSKGFGREWAIAALDRGDNVAATARDTSTLDDLVKQYGDHVLPLTLDVTEVALIVFGWVQPDACCSGNFGGSSPAAAFYSQPRHGCGMACRC